VSRRRRRREKRARAEAERVSTIPAILSARSAGFDWPSELGWSDAWITQTHIPEDIAHLTREELPMMGRLLRIEWLEGDDAQAVHDRYFKI
jgi:hypothetical protein